MASKIIDVFWQVFEVARNRESIPGPRKPINNYQRHVEIVEALARQDVEAMQAAIVHHFREGAGYWPWVDGQEPAQTRQTESGIDNDE